MSLALSPDVRPTVWDELDWSSAAPQLGQALLENEELDPVTKGQLLRELAELCEFCVLDPQSAADLYGASFQCDRAQIELLTRMRHLCHNMGRTDHAARTAELEFRYSKEPRFHAIAGQAWLDAGEPDRALKPLLVADHGSPGNPHLIAALEVARREWANPEVHAETLLSQARKATPETPIQALQAARILRMLDITDDRYEESLTLCLQESPNLPSACHLMERFLFSSDRLDELAAHFRRRSEAAPSKVMAARFLFQGSSLLFRAKAGSQGGPLFVAGLRLAIEAELRSIPGLLAQLRGLVASAASERKQVVELAEEVYGLLDSNDERVGVAIFCAQIAWHAQNDKQRAVQWMSRLKEHCDDHPLLADFDML